MHLLDTHTLLWYLRDSEELSEAARRAIDNAEKVFVSIASFWEIAIKQSQGKLRFNTSMQELEALCRERDIRVLNIRSVELERLKTLPDVHRDPFDRLLVAQALESGLAIVTRDRIIPQYPVQTIW